jgi:hypothetical protein
VLYHLVLVAREHGPGVPLPTAQLGVVRAPGLLAGLLARLLPRGGLEDGGMCRSSWCECL